MSLAQEFHAQAMLLAGDAFVARQKGDFSKYLELTESAFEKEKAAAWELFHKFEAEPTRSVLFRSAAQLAFNCGKLRESERLISAALAGNPPAEILAELRILARKILSAFAEAA